MLSSFLNTATVKPAIYLAIGAALVGAWVYIRRRPSPSPRREPQNEKGERTPGVWTPSSFRTPRPEPYPDFSITDTKPLPYRAFRYGPRYNVTMGLRALDHADWIEMDNQFPKFHADKAQRITERGAQCNMTAPEGYPAACELLEELAAYLPARYPSVFRRTTRGVDNLWSGESFDIVERPLKEDPITMCARLVQDDLAIMVERPDGQYYLLSGSIILPGFWRLDEKFGMPLSEIHTSGNVPQFRERLETGMLKFFARLKPEELYGRHNYFMQVDDGLAWSHSIGDEDSDHFGWFAAEKNKAIEHHWFRSERQTLKKLPRTGAVVFTIRTYFHPVSDVAQEDYVPGRLASAIRSWGDDVSKYKGKEKYGDILLEYLDGEHQKQLDRGLDLSKESEVHQYPW